MKLRWAAASLVLFVNACEHREPKSTDAPAVEEATELDRYLGDRAFRRETLLASLTSVDNHYSKRRIASYALERGGWDALPQWIPRVQAVREGVVKPSPEDWRPIWDGERPTSQAQWVELGRQVFFYFPLRAEAPAEYLLEHPQLAPAIGMGPASKGEWTGLVHFIDERAQARVGITCALCHTSESEGELIVGLARREFDYGQMRLNWYEGTPRPLDPELRQAMAAWGPGRADITDDVQSDPVAIPDLWRISELEYLTAAGTLRQVNTTALAIRQETQILFANGQRTRPPRELMWALAQFVYSLDAPKKKTQQSAPAPLIERGRELFSQHCSGCHSGSSGSGPLIDAELVGTDRALAFGPARGTARYRPAPLFALTRSSPYLHDGTVPTLEALLDPERLAPDYEGGAHKAGPIAGHEYGTRLESGDKAALIAFLREL